MTGESEGRDERESVRLRLEGTWLCREVNEHTCGTGKDGYYGAHEPGCGLIAEVDLSTLPGWDTLRSRPATEPSEGEVEAAAHGIAADRWKAHDGTPRPWGQVTPHSQQECRRFARAALRAARGVEA